MKYPKVQKCNVTVNSLFLACFLLLSPTMSQAALMHYTFKGVITGFASYHNDIDINDFDIVLNETKVKYVFEVDFEANNRIYTDSAGT